MKAKVNTLEENSKIKNIREMYNGVNELKSAINLALRIGIIGEPLWMRHWTSGFHKP